MENMITSKISVSNKNIDIDSSKEIKGVVTTTTTNKTRASYSGANSMMQFMKSSAVGGNGSSVPQKSNKAFLFTKAVPVTNNRHENSAEKNARSHSFQMKKAAN